MNKNLSERYNDGIVPVPDMPSKARTLVHLTQAPAQEQVALARKHAVLIAALLSVFMLLCLLAVLALVFGWV